MKLTHAPRTIRSTLAVIIYQHNIVNECLISNYLISGKRVVDAFSGMAGLGGMGLGILAWCHQQLRYKRAN